uniref:Uncharacterized protein n=1 Tax=Chryseobacterium sp. B5 TaxID=2050562 RepID=A0A2G7T9B6_9FLAO
MYETARIPSDSTFSKVCLTKDVQSHSEMVRMKSTILVYLAVVVALQSVIIIKLNLIISDYLFCSAMLEARYPATGLFPAWATKTLAA